MVDSWILYYIVFHIFSSGTEVLQCFGVQIVFIKPWLCRRFFAENAAITKYGAGEDGNICISSKDPPWEEANRKCMLIVDCTIRVQ
jgi:hypothetical protein